MKNNTIGKIAVATAERRNTLKNKSSDLHTTMDFGSVMCAKLQRCIPGTKISVGTKERVLLTSLVAPTFGRMSLKAYHRFVPFSDLTRNFGVMMGQEFVYRGVNATTPLCVPNLPLWELSLMVLFGAQMTIYEYGANYLDLRQIPAATVWNAGISALPTACRTAYTDLGLGTLSYYGLSGSYCIPLAGLLAPNSGYTYAIPLSNPTPASFFDYSTQHSSDLKGFGKSFVSPDGADYLIPVSVAQNDGSSNHYLLAFRLSSFGRRLRKNLIGCGWQFNIDDRELRVSLLPFFAYYKAYFDTFGLTLYQNWEQSDCYQLLQIADLAANPSYNLFKTNSSSSFDYIFRLFCVYELGSTYYTDEQDYVSAHTRTTAVSPNPSGLLTEITTDVDSVNGNHPNIDVTAITESEPSMIPTPLVANGHAFIDDVVHGHLDSKLLMRLYQQTNAQTIAGRRLAELLRVQGFGKYVEEHTSNFIGSWSLDLNVFDLPSQSDTYQNAHDGMRLGEMGAFGKSSGQHPMVSYTSQEDGYFITLMVVVPKGGYAETVDPDILCLNKWQQYQPKYDSLGYEFTRKLETVQGSQPWANMALNDGLLSQSFGLSPRDFKRKFGRNVINGDMSLRSARHTYQPFNLEKLISVGEHVVDAVDTSTSGLSRYPWESVNYLSPDRVPVAGNVWRMPTRYEWISAFNRIFYNDTPSVDIYNDFGVAYDDSMAYELFSLRDDNFIVHVIFDMQVWDQMLPVQDSFETDDEEKRSDTSISKA